MGFFGLLLSGVQTAAAIAANVATVAATAVTTAVAAAPIVIPAALVGYGVAAAAKKLFGTPQLSETSSANDVEVVANALADYRKQFNDKAVEDEKNFKDYVNKCFEEIISKLKRNPQIADQFNFERLTRKQSELAASIDGAITESVSKQLSLDNNRCCDILAMKPGHDRDNAMTTFVNETITLAKENLANTVSNALKQQTDDISVFLQNYIIEQELKIIAIMTQLEQWEHDMANGTYDKERAQLPALVKIYALEQIEKIIAA